MVEFASGSKNCYNLKNKENKEIEMHLKGKLFTFMFALFIFFSFCVWSYSEILFSKINEKWAERFIRKQIVFDKNRTLLPLLNEIEMIQEMIKEPD